MSEKLSSSFLFKTSCHSFLFYRYIYILTIHLFACFISLSAEILSVVIFPVTDSKMTCVCERLFNGRENNRYVIKIQGDPFRLCFVTGNNVIKLGAALIVASPTIRSKVQYNLQQVCNKPNSTLYSVAYMQSFPWLRNTDKNKLIK